MEEQELENEGGDALTDAQSVETPEPETEHAAPSPAPPSGTEHGAETSVLQPEAGQVEADIEAALSDAPLPPPETVSMEELMGTGEDSQASEPAADAEAGLNLRAVLEAVVYIADEPLTVAQMASALSQPAEKIQAALDELTAEFEKPEHGIAIREVAGGFKMATKAEHHDAVRSFVKSLKPPLKLSLPALETLAVIAYKQPVTGPEIMEIRGVQGGGVLKTLLDRKLIAHGGRKNVLGKPMLYKTTKEFLIQFGLKDLSELPSLKEFEEIRRMAFSDSEPAPAAPVDEVEVPAAAEEFETKAASPEVSEEASADADAEAAEPSESEADSSESTQVESASEKHEPES